MACIWRQAVKKLNLELWTQWSQIITAIVAVVIGCYSIYLGNRTVEQADAARVLGWKPHAGFILVGTGHVAQFNGNEWLAIGQDVGTVRNYGVGPALNINLEWVPLKVVAGDASLKLKSSSTRVYPANLMPGESAAVSTLPIFQQNGAQAGYYVRGKLVITCEDALGKPYTWEVPFQLANEPQADGANVSISFSDAPLRFQI